MKKVFTLFVAALMIVVVCASAIAESGAAEPQSLALEGKMGAKIAKLLRKDSVDDKKQIPKQINVPDGLAATDTVAGTEDVIVSLSPSLLISFNAYLTEKWKTGMYDTPSAYAEAVVSALQSKYAADKVPLESMDAAVVALMLEGRTPMVDSALWNSWVSV